MFGYVKPLIPMLRVGEYDTYKGVYCGLCRHLGKSFGPFARFTLSYDFTFAVMLYCGINNDKIEFSPQRCPYNPAKKKPHLMPCKGLDFCGDIAIIMLHFKCKDDINDSGFIKSIGYRSIDLFASSVARKCNQDAYNVVEKAMSNQFELEKEVATLDIACHPSAEALAFLFEMMTDDITNKKILYRLGYMLGRYVYICDAVDDIEKDRKSGQYNPLSFCDELHFAHNALRHSIAEAVFAYQLLNIGYFKEILDNIMYMGINDCAQKLIDVNKNMGGTINE